MVFFWPLMFPSYAMRRACSKWSLLLQRGYRNGNMWNILNPSHIWNSDWPSKSNWDQPKHSLFADSSARKINIDINHWVFCGCWLCSLLHQKLTNKSVIVVIIIIIIIIISALSFQPSDTHCGRELRILQTREKPLRLIECYVSFHIIKKLISRDQRLITQSHISSPHRTATIVCFSGGVTMYLCLSRMVPVYICFPF